MRVGKEVMVCVQYVMGKNNFLVQFEYGQKREMIYISLLYPCSKEEVCLEIEDPISDLLQK